MLPENKEKPVPTEKSGGTGGTVPFFRIANLRQCVDFREQIAKKSIFLHFYGKLCFKKVAKDRIHPKKVLGKVPDYLKKVKYDPKKL